MAYLKKSEQLRFLLDSTESPTTFPSLQHQGIGNSINSPMTDLAMNLNEAKLAGSPLGQLHPRRLSLSSDTPSPLVQPMLLHTGSVEATPMEVGEYRLLKNAIKFPGVGKDSSSGRNRGFTRRVSQIVSSENSGVNPLFGDKENCDVDMSTPNIPNKLNISPLKFGMRPQVSTMRPRQPLEDQDPNSQDSGYGAGNSDRLDPKTGFRFPEPSGVPPRRHLSDQSPLKENTTFMRNKSGGQSHSQKLFRCLSTGSGGDFLDDGFLEFDDKLTDVSNLPCGLTSLLSKPIIKDEIALNPPAGTKVEDNSRFFRRSMSLVENVTPNFSRVRSCLFKPPTQSSPMQQDDESPRDALRSFKRPDPPCDYVSPSNVKRRKANSLYSIHQTTVISEIKMAHLNFQRSHSDNEATIKTALHRSLQDPDLIGDFSKPYILPLIEGRHQDLKTISSETLAKLMEGHYSETVEMFTIVDCRYPYEFDGGHIKGAKNIYTKDQVLKDLVNGMQAEAKCELSMSVKRKHIMVFHCEFSSERGPNLYRFLRNSDRTKNEEFYPALYYPELYLLDGGYKQFYEHHRTMCEPQEYRPMLHPSHEGDLRHFRARTKSWNGDTKSRLTLRNSFKRLGNETNH